MRDPNSEALTVSGHMAQDENNSNMGYTIAFTSLNKGRLHIDPICSEPLPLSGQK